MNNKRPIGITIISILLILNGSFLLLGGIATFILTINFPSSFDTLDSVPFTIESNNTNFQISDSEILKNINHFLYFIAGIITLFSLVHFVIAYGLLKGKSWARTTTIIISIISIVSNTIIILIVLSIFAIIESISSGQSILGGNILTILINSIIVYYLYRKDVKDYFHNINKKSSFSSSLDDLR
jgi:uncharacterized membrane protein (DUF2068 family)